MTKLSIPLNISKMKKAFFRPKKAQQTVKKIRRYAELVDKAGYENL